MLSYISNGSVDRIISWEAIIPVLHDALLAFYSGSSGGAIQPLRTRMKVQKHEGELLLMPGYLSRNDILAVKLVTIYPNNASKELATHSALIILFDGITGIPRALLDAESITAKRTAAVSAIVSKSLGYEGCQRIAIIGSGIQGSSHSRALHHVLRPSIVCVWSRKSVNAADLVANLKKEGINAESYEFIEKCVEGCDVITTCTLSATPILKKEWIKNQCHINAIGAASPNLQEIDPAIMQSATVYVDSIESAKNESGDVILSKITDLENLQDILQCKRLSPKPSITVFKNLGLAIEDAAAAGLVYKLFNEEIQVPKS